ncbi:MAG: DUF1559 domain-containing protein [Planctomycetaceae bacterium]
MKYFVMIVLAIFIFWIILNLPKIKGAREAAPRTQCMNNLKQIGLALHHYHDKYGSFPPAYIADEDGKPMHSWRVLILAELKQDKLYQEYRFDEPWDGPHNRTLHDRIPSVYRCPSYQRDAHKNFSSNYEGKTMTNYVAIDDTDAFFQRSNVTLKADITDGLSKTMAVFETHHHVVHWMQPDDITPDEAIAELNTCAENKEQLNHEGGTYILIGDGSVRFISSHIANETLRALMTRSGGEPIPEY